MYSKGFRRSCFQFVNSLNILYSSWLKGSSILKYKYKRLCLSKLSHMMTRLTFKRHSAASTGSGKVQEELDIAIPMLFHLVILLVNIELICSMYSLQTLFPVTHEIWQEKLDSDCINASSVEEPAPYRVVIKMLIPFLAICFLLFFLWKRYMVKYLFREITTPTN